LQDCADTAQRQNNLPANFILEGPDRLEGCAVSTDNLIARQQIGFLSGRAFDNAGDHAAARCTLDSAQVGLIDAAPSIAASAVGLAHAEL
jgi:hypothetical protein